MIMKFPQEWHVAPDYPLTLMITPFSFQLGVTQSSVKTTHVTQTWHFDRPLQKMAVQVRVLQLEANQDLENQLYILEKGKVFLLWEPTNDRTLIECFNTFYKLK